MDVAIVDTGSGVCAIRHAVPLGASAFAGVVQLDDLDRIEEACEHLRADGFRTAVIWLFDADAGTQAFYESAGWALDGGRRELDMGVRIPEVRLHTDIS